MDGKSKLLIIEDQKMISDCISDILKSNKNLEIIGCAATLEVKTSYFFLDIFVFIFYNSPERFTYFLIK
jgi:response regulator of citrate/malate metabolism